VPIELLKEVKYKIYKKTFSSCNVYDCHFRGVYYIQPHFNGKNLYLFYVQVTIACKDTTTIESSQIMKSYVIMESNTQKILK